MDSVSNLGGTFPRIFVLKLVDVFTSATCSPASGPLTIPPLDASSLSRRDNATPTVSGTPFDPFSCALESAKHTCRDLGGRCDVHTDGYYITNVLCVVIGAVSFAWYIRPRVKRLMGLPLKSWREYVD